MKTQPFNNRQAIFFVSEYSGIIQFAENEDFEYEVVRNQLQCLWTAYCIRWDRNVDTGSYYTELSEIYGVISRRGTELPAGFKEYESFYNFMSEYLI